MPSLDDILKLLSKQSAGALDSDLNSLADKLEKLNKAKQDLRTLLNMAGKFKKPSEYTPDFKKKLDAAGIDYSDGDGDHKKNVQKIQDAIDKIDDLEQMTQVQTQKLTSDMQKLFDAMSSQLQKIHKQQDDMLKNIRG